MPPTACWPGDWPSGASASYNVVNDAVHVHDLQAMGGNQRGTLMMYRNLFLTMVISGLWHGAAWTFVIWGAVHALAMMATRSAERSTWYAFRVPKFAKQMVVFGVVWFAWIFFRAESLSDAWLIVTRIFTAAWADPAVPLLALTLIAVVWLYQFMYESTARRLLELSAVRIALVVCMIVYLCTVPGSGGAAFIYFQF